MNKKKVQSKQKAPAKNKVQSKHKAAARNKLQSKRKTTTKKAPQKAPVKKAQKQKAPTKTTVQSKEKTTSKKNNMKLIPEALLTDKRAQEAQLCSIDGSGLFPELLADKLYGPSFANYVLLTNFPEEFRDAFTDEDIFWNRYYWFLRFVKLHHWRDGPDAGMDQQAFQLIEYPPCEVDWLNFERVETQVKKDVDAIIKCEESRPYPAPPSWPSPVIKLAEALYAGEDCSFALHDALLEAGHPELAEHFAKEHPKGCWVLDLILAKR